ncbi:hypothetical protein AgCh_037123 [Apium graveolens]
MYRSVSTSRLDGNNEGLPLYEQQGITPEVIFKKEKSRSKFSERAVHLIPFVIVFCALVLWFFSNPDVDLPSKGDSIAGRIEGLTLEGDIDSDGTQRGVLPHHLDLGDVLMNRPYQDPDPDPLKN